METRLLTKTVNGKKVACASSGENAERAYPQCRSKFAFFDALRGELALPASTPMKEVARVLKSKSWSGKAWVEDKV